MWLLLCGLWRIKTRNKKENKFILLIFFCYCSCFCLKSVKIFELFLARSKAPIQILFSEKRFREFSIFYTVERRLAPICSIDSLPNPPIARKFCWQNIFFFENDVGMGTQRPLILNVLLNQYVPMLIGFICKGSSLKVERRFILNLKTQRIF